MLSPGNGVPNTCGEVHNRLPLLATNMAVLAFNFGAVRSRYNIVEGSNLEMGAHALFIAGKRIFVDYKQQNQGLGRLVKGKGK